MSPRAKKPFPILPILTGLLAIASFIGGVAAWSLLAPIESAVVSPGVVSVASYRKTIQHLEGGIVREILVQDGDSVERGQLLIQLSNVQPSAEAGQLRDQYAEVRAIVARLLAERDDRPEITFPDELLVLASEDPSVERALEGQEGVFASRRRNLDDRLSVFRQQIEQTRAEIAGLEGQIMAIGTQLALAEEEYREIKGLYDQNLIPKPRMLELRGRIAELEGADSKLRSTIARERKSILETEAQMGELKTERIGQGANQRHVFASVTSKTSFWACRLSGDKRHTNRRLAELGLPVPKQIKVRDALEAEEAAAQLGMSIVIKPLKGKKGGAVTAGIKALDQVVEAFTLADQAGSGVIVEQFVEGNDHRLLVIGGRFIAATKRMPPRVEGDGEQAIKQLINELNDDPARDDFRMMKVNIDSALETYLLNKGHALGDVPGKGEVIALRSTANGSTGGVFSDVTTSVHPDNQALAIRAAQAVELDVAGIDFMTTDISRSYKEIGGRIIEINSRPGLRPHTWPSHGEPRDVAGAMLDFSLPGDSDGRVPTLLVAGDRGTGPIARELDVILRGAGKFNGLVTRQATHLDGEPAGFDEKQQNKAASILLSDPGLETLVSTVSLRQAVKRGLAFDRCHAAAIMNRAIEGDVDLFRMGLDVIARAAGRLVVGAGNTVALEALADLDTSRLILVSPRLRDSVIERHLSAGGAAVIKLWNAEHDRIELYDNDQVITAIAVDPTVTRSGTRAEARRIEAKMFAVALAYSAGMAGPDIEMAIRNAPEPVPRPMGHVPADVVAEATPSAT